MSVCPPRRTPKVPAGFRPVDLFVVMATPPSPVGGSVVTSEPPPPPLLPGIPVTRTAAGQDNCRRSGLRAHFKTHRLQGGGHTPEVETSRS